jgi:hypothetical protein
MTTLREAMREWDAFDFLAAGGMLALTGSAVAAMAPSLRRKGLLFPAAIGVAMMAAAAFGARNGNGKAGLAFDDEEPPAIAPPSHG